MRADLLLGDMDNKKSIGSKHSHPYKEMCFVYVLISDLDVNKAKLMIGCWAQAPDHGRRSHAPVPKTTRRKKHSEDEYKWVRKRGWVVCFK